ncbi:unnamed protein product [Arctia plantaginis]|uniref:Uncharacterized protein n=1 Tax=Arctia plantaginis TaxID=874455 RepID=A0A8S1A7T9_ARCPL|nr:unnamed protein product [Arctia plantaginis]
MAKSLLVLYAAACLFKIISAQCIGAGNVMAADELALSGNALAYGAGFGAFGAGPVGYGAAPFGAAPGYGFNSAATSGGGFAVTRIVSEGLAPTAAPAAYPAGHNYGAAGFGPGMGYPGMPGRSFNGLGGLGAVY